MPHLAHLLLVRAGGVLWGLPMESVEQTFSLRDHKTHRVGSIDVVVFRGKTLELHDLAAAVGHEERRKRDAAVVVWAGGRRRAFGVDQLVGQSVLEPLELPEMALGRFCSAVVLFDGHEIVPILQPGPVVGAWEVGGDRSFGFTEMQQSALLEIANIGSGHAATALSQLLGKAVEISYGEALVATLAEAADRIGAAAAQSAVVETPIVSGGKVLLLFPDGSGDKLCELLGTSVEDEMGREALREVGNILASSYLNAIVQMTGLPLEPEPPTIEIDILGTIVEQSIASAASPNDPTVLLRSVMTVETSDAKFAFLFVPQVGAVQTLLDALGVGAPAYSELDY